MINCRLTKNITLNQYVDGDPSQSLCNSVDVSMGIGGIRSPLYVFNIDDVENLKFTNDNRVDESLDIEEIIYHNSFYSIDFTSAEYTEEYDDRQWEHTLELQIANITPLFEELLFDSVGGKYLVCFKPNGAEDYRVFGWRNGASLDYSMKVNETDLGYTVTFFDKSEYPLMNCWSENFNQRLQTFSPLWMPLYDASLCELSNGANNGYSVAMYVTKVNSAGQALGADNRLTQWTGLKQDAYKLETVAGDHIYNILGTYNANASYNGRPVRVYDLNMCPANANGTITINGKKEEFVKLNSTTKSVTATLLSDNDWVMINPPSHSQVLPTQGTDGSTTLNIIALGAGGTDDVLFENKYTREQVTLHVEVNILQANEEYVYPNGTTKITLFPVVQGCSSEYTSSLGTVNADGSLTITAQKSDQEQTFNVTLTHKCDANEKKTVKIIILGNNTDPAWVILSRYCENA